MTPRDLKNIHTTGNSCRDTLPCANMALKLPRYFYLLMEKPLGHYFQVRSPYYQAAQCNQKTLILVSSRWQASSEKAKKKISIKTNHSYHHPSSPKPVPTDLAIKPDSDLTNPVGKDGGVKLVGVNYPFCCDTITRRLKRHLLSRWYDWPGWRPTQYFNV